MSNTNDEKLDYRRILPIFVIVLIDLLGLTIIIPLLPLYATSLRATPLTIGFLGAAYPVMQFLGAPLLGRLSDRFGRRPILLISQIGTLAGFLVLGLANALWLLFLSRIIDGLSGANISTAQAAITDSTTDKTRTQGLGLIGAAFGLGFIIGPLIAFVSLAVSGNNYHAPAFLAAGFSLISILLTLFWLDETLPAEQRRQAPTRRETFSFGAMGAALRRPQIGILLVLMAAQQLAFGGFEQLLSLFTLNRLGLNASGNAVIFVFVGVIVVAVQGGLIGRWSRAYGDRRLVLAGLSLLAVGLTLMAFTPRQAAPWYSRAALEAELNGDQRQLPGETPPTQDLFIALPDESQRGWLGLGWLLIMMIPAGIGGGILQPAINSLLTRQVSPAEVGGILGISAAFYSGANAIAPVLGGAIFEGVGPAAPFIVWGVLMASLFVLARRRVQPDHQTAAPQQQMERAEPTR